MSFMEALSFPFQDKNWVTKFAIAIVALFIPILGWLVLAGYGVRVVRNVQNNVNELPEFDDFGSDLSRGFMAFLGGLIYAIPSIILSCCNSVLTSGDNSGLAALGCLISLVQFAYSIAITPVVYSAMARFAQNEDINVFFDFGGRINDVTQNMNNALMLYLNVIVLGIVTGIATTIGLIACCIPGLIAIAAGSFATYHLIGQWGKILGVGNSVTTGFAA